MRSFSPSRNLGMTPHRRCLWLLFSYPRAEATEFAAYPWAGRCVPVTSRRCPFSLHSFAFSRHARSAGVLRDPRFPRSRRMRWSRLAEGCKTSKIISPRVMHCRRIVQHGPPRPICNTAEHSLAWESSSRRQERWRQPTGSLLASPPSPRRASSSSSTGARSLLVHSHPHSEHARSYTSILRANCYRKSPHDSC